MSNPIVDGIISNAIPVASVVLVVYTLVTGKSEKSAERAEKVANAAKDIEALWDKYEAIYHEQTKMTVLVGQHDSLIGHGQLTGILTDLQRAKDDIAEFEKALTNFQTYIHQQISMIQAEMRRHQSGQSYPAVRTDTVKTEAIPPPVGRKRGPGT